MGRVWTAIFTVACMVIIAISIGSVLVFQFNRPAGEATSIALALLCAMFLMHMMISRSRERSEMTETVERLDQRVVELDDDMENLEGRLSGMEYNLPRRAREEIDPLFAEVEVLGTLVKQMAEAVGDLEDRFDDQQALPQPPQMSALPHHSESAAMAPHERAYAQPAPLLQGEGYRPHSGETQAARQPAHATAAPSSHPGEGNYDDRYRESVPHRDEGRDHEAPRPSGIFSQEYKGQNSSVTDQPGRAEEHEKPKHESDPAMREMIISALNANRVELHLQPIVTLPQRQVKYYEAFTRLRNSNDESIEAAAFVPEAARSGLIARIDNLQLFRSVQVIRRLTTRNRNAALFCNVSSLSLVDETFFPGFLEFVRSNRSFVDVIIFEFTQDDVAQMGVVEMESLNALAEIGFQFSMDQISNMSMDFRGWAQRGFKYAKVHADYLIGRHGADTGNIHPSDFGDLLHRQGVQLIPTHIETESQVLELLDFEVNLGQGFLFSPPRPVRAEVLQGAPAPSPRKRA